MYRNNMVSLLRKQVTSCDKWFYVYCSETFAQITAVSEITVTLFYVAILDDKSISVLFLLLMCMEKNVPVEEMFTQEFVI